MPIYAYRCEKCNHNFEQYVADYDKRDEVKCNMCGDKANRDYQESCQFVSHGLPNGHIAARAK